MTTALSNTLPAYDLRRALFASVGLWVATLALAVAMGRTIGIAAVIALPAFLWLLTAPRVAFYLFVLAVPIYLPIQEAGFVLWPFDVLLMVLALGLILETLLQGSHTFRRTPFDLPLAALALATWLSALFAYRGAETIVPSIRILVILVSFRAAFIMTLKLGVRRIVLLYIGIVFVLSLINIGIFLYYRGTIRVFGISDLAFETYAMTALPMALAFFIWARDRGERFRYGLIAAAIALAIFASGSRGPLLAGSLGAACLLVLAWRKTRREQNVNFAAAIFPLAAAGAAVAVVVAASSTSFFGLFLTRVGEAAESVRRPVGTIELRLVLWTAALKAWLTSPIVGIGIGNFDLVDRIVPEMRMVPVWYYIRGISAHNVVLHYLAETGLVGVIALLSIPWAGLKTVARFYRAKMNLADTQVSMAITIAIIVFAMSLFFMRVWTWSQEGHILALLLAMASAWHYQHSPAGD